MNRNLWFAGTAVAASAMAMATGALLSGATAGADAPAANRGSLTMVQASEQDAFRCTFDDVALPSGGPMMGGAAPDGQTSFSASAQLDESGMQAVEGQPQAGVVVASSSGIVPADPAGELPDDMTVLTEDDIREGTDEECRAMLDAAPDFAPAVATEP